MKFLPKLALATTAFLACTVGAQAALSDQADQERRDRNREEALAAYRAQNGGTTAPRGDRTLRGKAHDTAETVRDKAHDTADTVRGKTHRTAQNVRGFTHRQAEKTRDFGARHGARRGMANTEPPAHGEGMK
jgi:hypothetical protein